MSMGTIQNIKNSVITGLLLLASSIVLGQTHRYNTNFSYSLRNFVDTIPVDYQDGQLFVTATVGGRLHRFCIDTGSGQGSIFDRSALTSDLENGGQTNGIKELGNVVSRDAAGHLDTVKVVQLPPFQIGRLTVTGYVASVFHSAIRRSYDAILGFDLINKGLCCKIDTRRGIMVITDRRDFFDGEPGFALHYELKWWVPYVTVSPFKRHYDEVLFDIGSKLLYTMNKQSFDEHAYKSKNVNSQVVDRVKGNIAIGNIGAERTDEVAFLRLNRLKWDDFSFLNVSAVTTQGASRIGAEMLSYGSVIINGFRRYIRFQPYEGGDSVMVNNKPLTTAYVPTPDGMAQVGIILPSSSDYKAGLRQGDIILAIDGKAIASFTTFQQYPFIEGKKHKLLVRTTDGRNKEVIVTK